MPSDKPVAWAWKPDDIVAAGDPDRTWTGQNVRRTLMFPLKWSNGLTLASLDCMDFPLLLQRVRAEFNEMPGLRLTPPQAARLLGLDNRSCHKVISALVNSEFLRWTPDGSVVRTES